MKEKNCLFERKRPMGNGKTQQSQVNGRKFRSTNKTIGPYVARISISLLLFCGLFLCRVKAEPAEVKNAFLDAIIDGNIQTVEGLLAKDPNLISAVDYRHKGEFTPALHLAVAHGHKDIVELLLSKGASPNLRDENRASPLEVAAKRGRANVVASLVSYGGDIKGGKQESHRSPLFFASNGEVAEALIANGADVRGQDKLNITPLHFVAGDGAIEAARVLVKHGAEVDARDKWGETPLHWAVKHGQKDVAELLLDAGADINARDNSGFTALNRLVQEDRMVGEARRKETGCLLLSQGAECTISDAACFGDVNKVQQLLDSNPDLVNTIDKGTREQPLCTTVLAGEANVADALLTHGANADAMSRFGLPCLNLASALGNEDIVKMLLDNGADVNREGKSGGTALHWAAAKGHKNIVQLLLEAGANVNAAASRARCDINLLAPKDFDTLRYWLRYLSDCEKQRQAMAAGQGLQIMGPIRAAFAAGDTPLHSAAQGGYTEIVQLLLNNGAVVDSTNESQQTPLHYASAFRQKEVIQLLLDAGANVNTKEKNGYTPLTLACWPKSSPDNDVAELLVQRGAK
jgi:ankyrin repeat protein